MKQLLEFETIINCSVETLYAFHADTRNLPAITPLDVTVEIISLEEKLLEGNRAKLNIKKGLISFVWELVFETVNKPYLIVDVATKSPFKTFRHEHHFIKVDDAHSILRDVVTFSLPFWPLSSVALWFIKKDMKKMFNFRHIQTKNILERLVER